MMNKIKKLYKFIRKSTNRRLYLKVFFLSGYFRINILTMPKVKLQKLMGVFNEESAQEEPTERYRQAAVVAKAVNRVCEITPWESKCLVRALTAQSILKKLQIPSTLYLGVGKKEDEMMAHAWLRTGKYYITGGSGEGLALVAKFRS